MIVHRVQHIFTKRFSICLTGEGQSREKGTQAEKKNWRMIYEKCRLVYLNASRRYFELYTWLYMTKIYVDSIYEVSASASEDSASLPEGVSRLFGTCVASRACIQIATPRFHCHVIARCTQLMLTGYTILHSLRNHWKRSRLESRRLVCAFPRRRDLAYFMDDVFTMILYFETHHKTLRLRVRSLIVELGANTQ